MVVKYKNRILVKVAILFLVSGLLTAIPFMVCDLIRYNNEDEYNYIVSYKTEAGYLIEEKVNVVNIDDRNRSLIVYELSNGDSVMIGENISLYNRLVQDGTNGTIFQYNELKIYPIDNTDID